MYYAYLYYLRHNAYTGTTFVQIYNHMRHTWPNMQFKTDLNCIQIITVYWYTPLLAIEEKPIGHNETAVDNWSKPNGSL